jgi:hypothetical protein
MILTGGRKREIRGARLREAGKYILGSVDGVRNAAPKAHSFSNTSIFCFIGFLIVIGEERYNW